MTISVNGPTGVGTVQNSPAVAGSPGALPGSLLPMPDMNGDAMSGLYALFSKDHQLGLSSKIKDLRNAQRLKKQQWERAKAALKKAMKARKKGGFFKKLAKTCLKIARYAAVAAAVALAVGTGGAGVVGALAIAGAVMSCTAMAQSEFQILQRLGVSEQWANGIEWGLTIGSAACTLGAGVATLFGASANASALGNTLGTAGACVQGVSTAGAGFATWQASEADSDALHHQANAAKERAEEARLERMLIQIMSEIESSEEADQRTLGHLRGAMEARDNAITMASTKV
ncbi:MAG: hypothetical protein R3B13_32990 [Polyangiaceae bacterium]